MPIHFLHKSVVFEELVALYAIADACLVSSTRDGMNLVCLYLISLLSMFLKLLQVSYEYIVCQQKNHGVLVLSEFAGAAQSLNGKFNLMPFYYLFDVLVD
jgi:trehalose-6-phosphate synthase